MAQLLSICFHRLEVAADFSKRGGIMMQFIFEFTLFLGIAWFLLNYFWRKKGE